MAKRVRLDRFSVSQADELFRRNRMNIYGQEQFIDLYGKNGDDFSHIWFEELEFRARLVDNRALTEVSGRYCVKKNLDGKRERYEKEFRGLEDEKLQVTREGPYKLRYRRK